MSTQAPIASLLQLFDQLGLSYRAHDCGALIRPLRRQQFEQFEAGTAAYPFPYLGQAQMGLVLWAQGQAQSPNIWFLRFRLDEQGKLKLSGRDEFLGQLLTTLGRNLQAAQDGEALKAVLDNNPYCWQPAPAQQAAFHGNLTATLKLPTSSHYADALHYLTLGPWEHWQALGLQGLADLAARWQEPENYCALSQSLTKLPLPVWGNLSQLLEHFALDVSLTELIAQRLQTASEQSGESPALKAEQASALRACASSAAEGVVMKILADCLCAPTPLDAEALVIIATRHCQRLADSPLCLPFLEQLALLGQSAFNRIMAELMFQPGLRAHFMAAFRLPQRSDQLSTAIGGLLTLNGH